MGRMSEMATEAQERGEYPDHDDSGYELHVLNVQREAAEKAFLDYVATIPDPWTRSQEQQAEADRLDKIARDLRYTIRRSA